MIKRDPGRPRKRGRPKGSRNKKIYNPATDDVVMEIPTNNKNLIGRTFSLKEVETFDLKSRLDECMVKLETAVAEAISKLKASI